MLQVLAPLEAEAVQKYGQHLEVIVLLVAHHIHHFVNGEVAETEFGGADVLSHVDRSAVRAEQQLVVQSLGRQVGPDGTVLPAVHLAFLQALQHQLLALQVGLRLIVYLVEVHAHLAVCLVETGVNPRVHRFPQLAHLGIVLLPLHQHLAGLLHQRRRLLGFVLAHALCLQLLHFLLEVLVEQHVEVADQVVALLSRRFGSDAFAPFLPCQHRLADVDAAVVHYVGLDYLIAVGLQYLGQRISQQVVAHVSQVQGLVGVWAGIFHHHQLRVVTGLDETEVRVGLDAVEHREPPFGADHDVQEPFHHVEAFHSRHMVGQPLTYFLGRDLRSLVRGLEPREHHYREVALKVLAGGCRRYARRIYVESVKLV